MSLILDQFRRVHSAFYPERWEVYLIGVHEQLVGGVRSALLVLMGLSDSFCSSHAPMLPTWFWPDRRREPGKLPSGWRWERAAAASSPIR